MLFIVQKVGKWQYFCAQRQGKKSENCPFIVSPFKAFFCAESSIWKVVEKKSTSVKAQVVL